MGIRVDEGLRRLAAGLGPDVVAAFAGGELGALHVRDRGGRDAVLKGLPDPAREGQLRRGAAIATRLRESGYPAPAYLGVGVDAGWAWTMQELLPGEIPQPMTVTHAEQLVALARRHEGMADGPGTATADALAALTEEAGRLLRDARTAAIAHELQAVAAATAGVRLRTDDVSHGDFHFANYLADGDRVTGVFDWEGAMCGDWRADVAYLACWSAWVPHVVPPDALAVVVEAAEEVCPPEVLALFAAGHAALVLDFYADARDADVAWAVDASRVTARWWRAVL